MNQGGKLPMPEWLIIRDSIDNIAEWRKRVILLEEVDIHRLEITREHTAQHWTLESTEKR